MPPWRSRPKVSRWTRRSVSVFFFQAEDGIRDGRVTGVQTCALPICPGGIYEPLVVTPAIGVRMETEARILPLDGSNLPVRVTVHAQSAAEGTLSLKLRSEERRVGKECRAGWSGDEEKKKREMSEEVQ